MCQLKDNNNSDIENIYKELNLLKLNMNKKEDDIKNIITEKGIIITEKTEKIRKQEKTINRNENLIKTLEKKLNEMQNKLENFISFESKENYIFQLEKNKLEEKEKINY